MAVTVLFFQRTIQKKLKKFKLVPYNNRFKCNKRRLQQKSLEVAMSLQTNGVGALKEYFSLTFYFRPMEGYIHPPGFATVKHS